MIAPPSFGKCQQNGGSIALAATLALLTAIAPHEASAKAGSKVVALFQVPRQRRQLLHEQGQ
jgi:hypothetical protein